MIFGFFFLSEMFFILYFFGSDFYFIHILNKKESVLDLDND